MQINHLSFSAALAAFVLLTTGACNSDGAGAPDDLNGDGGSESCPRGRPPSDCSQEATCEAAYGCGPTAPFLDVDGCRKLWCRGGEFGNEPCADNFVCAPVVVFDACGPSVLEGCDESNGACECSVSADCSRGSYCVPEGTEVCEYVDDVDDCSELTSLMQEFEHELTDEDHPEDSIELLEECMQHLNERARELDCTD